MKTPFGENMIIYLLNRYSKFSLQYQVVLKIHLYSNLITAQERGSNMYRNWLLVESTVFTCILQNTGNFQKCTISFPRVKTYSIIHVQGRRGHDRVVVGFSTICAVGAYHHVHGEVYSIQPYVILFDSALRQVGGFFHQ